MADDKMMRAQNVYNTLCATMDELEWHYTKIDEKLSIHCNAQGDDLPIDLVVNIDTERQLIILLSQLPLTVPEEKRLDVAIATSVANYGMVDGSFDFDITDGRMFFRMTSSFIESEIGKELLAYMVLVSCRTIDDYNDKFLMLAKGMISIEQFIANE